MKHRLNPISKDTFKKHVKSMRYCLDELESHRKGVCGFCRPGYECPLVPILRKRLRRDWETMKQVGNEDRLTKTQRACWDSRLDEEIFLESFMRR